MLPHFAVSNIEIKATSSLPASNMATAKGEKFLSRPLQELCQWVQSNRKVKA
jgi:hypothetical protein